MLPLGGATGQGPIKRAPVTGHGPTRSLTLRSCGNGTNRSNIIISSSSSISIISSTNSSGRSSSSINLMEIVVCLREGNGARAHKTGTRDMVVGQQLNDIQKW